MKTKPAYAMILLMALAAGLLSGCSTLLPGGGPAEPTLVPTVVDTGEIITEGRVVPRETTTLAFQTSGRIEPFSLSEGQVVEAGEVLIRLADREALLAAQAAARLEALAAQQALDTLSEKAALMTRQAQFELANARQTLNEAENTVNTLDTQEFRDELDERELDVEDARDNLKDAQETLDRYANLDPDNTTRKNAQDDVDEAQQELDDAIYQRDRLKNQLETARASLALAEERLADAERNAQARQDGPDPDELALAQARLDQAIAQLSAADAALSRAEIAAPFNGTIVDLLNLSAGGWASPGQAAVVLADTSAWYVETTDLTELDVVNLTAGQEVTLDVDALPGQTFSGEIETIGNTFSERSGDVLYTVRILMTDPPAELRWGMTVRVTINP